MGDFDFIKAFVGVELLQVEAVSKIVGRAVGGFTEGCKDAGLTDDQAMRVTSMAIAEVAKAMAMLIKP